MPRLLLPLLALALFAAPIARAEVPVSDRFKAAEAAALDLSNRAQALRQQSNADSDAGRYDDGCRELRDSQALFLQIHPLAERMIAEMEWRKSDEIDTYRGFLASTQYAIEQGDKALHTCGSHDPGWAISPEVTEMRRFSELHVTVAQTVLSLKENPDPSLSCPPLEELLTLVLVENKLMPGYLAATGREDSPLDSRRKWQAMVNEARNGGLIVWYNRCSGTAKSLGYSDWSDADSSFMVELKTFQATATMATDAMEATQYDQVCAPLRKSMAMMVGLQNRLITLKTLAGNDSDRLSTYNTYDNAVTVTLNYLIEDAKACADGFFARPLYAWPLYAGTGDPRDDYAIIPTFLKQFLEEDEQKHDVLVERINAAVADYNKAVGNGYDRGACVAKQVVLDLVADDVSLINGMAGRAAKYPRLAAYFRNQAEDVSNKYSSLHRDCDSYNTSDDYSQSRNSSNNDDDGYEDD